jgi:7,8-dihydro-6-hydroxymethylpterin-pyrophosphokinase
MNKRALVSFKTFSGRGIQKLKEALSQAQDFLTIERISNVYRVERPADSFMSIVQQDGEEELEGFVVVAEVAAPLATKELAHRLWQLETSFKDQVTRRIMSVNLLMVSGETVKTPNLTLPHPEFHLRPEELVPACELWPRQVHPILNKTIGDLAKTIPEKTWGEFYCQGSRLLYKDQAEEVP